MSPAHAQKLIKQCGSPRKLCQLILLEGATKDERLASTKKCFRHATHAQSKKIYSRFGPNLVYKSHSCASVLSTRNTNLPTGCTLNRCRNSSAGGRARPERVIIVPRPSNQILATLPLQCVKILFVRPCNNRATRLHSFTPN